ncbi:hypothetical protein K438DRAFT_1968755 [Mycena galopus ATCC 62051]|nr:hypothetical protein K438DRAFT_1968755 [Mycena galopus ATCC 62051]
MSFFANSGGPDPPSALPPEFTGTIACYFVVHQAGKANVEEMLPEISIIPNMLTPRGTALSITVGNLFFSLRLYQAGEKIGNPIIRDLLTGDSQSFLGATLSTTRVPDFESVPGYSAASAGFRHLITLQQAETRDSLPPLVSLNSEIIATAETSNVLVAELLRIWEPMGIIPKLLFTVIVTVPADTTSFLPTIFTPGPSISSSQETRLPSPHPTLSQASSYFNTAYAGGKAAHETSTYWPTASEPFHPDLTQDPPAPNSRAPTFSKHETSFTEDRNLADIYLAAQFTQDASLTQMIRQHESMSQLLWLLSFSVTQLKATKSITFADGSDPVNISGQAALRGCDWNPQTFTNKTMIYAGAKLSSQYRWSGVPPLVTEIAESRLYKVWCGAQFLWSVLGPVGTGIEPDPASTFPAEVDAAVLNQTTLSQIKGDKFRDKYLTVPLPLTE